MDSLELVKDWFNGDPILANKAARLYNQLVETQEKAFLSHPNGHKIQVLKLEVDCIIIGIPGHFSGYKTILTRNQIKRFLKMEVKEEKVNSSSQQQNTNSNPRPGAYLNPDDYKRRTGQRFRMTKDQKLRGLTRMQAFRETYG